jgi:hypothetical protein
MVAEVPLRAGRFLWASPDGTWLWELFDSDDQPYEGEHLLSGEYDSPVTREGAKQVARLITELLTAGGYRR